MPARDILAKTFLRARRAVSPLYTYLTMTVGGQAGTNFVLDPNAENRLGRGIDGVVVLTDPLCSRVHATIRHAHGAWTIRDAESRNGTYVNGQKIDEAVLAEGHYIRIGSSEFVFHAALQAPAGETANDQLNFTQTIIRDKVIDPDDTGSFALAAIRDTQQAKQFVVLYQLAIKLVGANDPDEVTRIALELLRAQTGASVVGFLWVNDQGQLTPKLVIPEEAAEGVVISESLTEVVAQQGHAIWIAKQKGAGSKDLTHYADALCVPLVSKRETLGAIHVYLERGRFRQGDFDFTISVANILVVALVRARHDKTLHANLQRLTVKSAEFDELVGESPAMLNLKTKISRLSRATGCVLVRGESGSGKELVARALHRASTRADRPMLSVNCAAIPADLMESQLFGHQAGAFTGADRNHLGYFQQADAGTLFLDEVGELTLEGQAKLLRILEGHPFLPVGASREVRVDVRVIAATNQDLQTYVRERKFREDLFYRLSVFELTIPPLRERGEDISLLLDVFLEHFRRQNGRPGLRLSDQARAKLLAYNWPGNVRQLRNVIDSAVVLAGGNLIEPSDLGLRDTGGGELESLKIDYWERRLIGEALKRTGGSVPEAAKLLGIGRATLYRKIEEFGITR